MPTLPTFPLPLAPNGPPPGYEWEERDISVSSTTTAFNTGIDRRDTFLGARRCVICGISGNVYLQHCDIIRQSEPDVWSDLQDRGWIPPQAKAHPEHEPRNGLIMCSNHRLAFDGYAFFIRFMPDFVLINYSGEPGFQQFHCKAVALDIKDRYTPFPALYIIHEMRVRGHHPFEPIELAMPNDILWQDWIASSGVFDGASNSFRRDRPANDRNRSAQTQLQLEPTTTTTTQGVSPGQRSLALNADVVNDILAVTRAMLSTL